VPRNPDDLSINHQIGTGNEDTKGNMPDNAFIEAFNSKLRSEWLNAHWFMSLDDAHSRMEEWRRYYNEERPHSGIGQNTPIHLHNFGGASSPSLAKEAENSSLR
jgi:transposase InsO family protein